MYVVERGSSMLQIWCVYGTDFGSTVSTGAFMLLVKKILVCYVLNAPYPLCAFQNCLRHKRRQRKPRPGNAACSYQSYVKCLLKIHKTLSDGPTKIRSKIHMAKLFVLIYALLYYTVLDAMVMKQKN